MSEMAKTLSLALLAVASLAVAMFTAPRSTDTSQLDDTGEKFFPELSDPLSVAKLTIQTYDKSTGDVTPFEVERAGGVFRIPSHENYPADAESRLGEATAQLSGLIKGSKITDSKGDHAQYGLLAPSEEGAQPGQDGVGTRITLRNNADEALADLIVGIEDDETPGVHYVRLAEGDRVYRAKINLSVFSTKFEDWIEDDLLKLQAFDIRALKMRNYSVRKVMTPDGQRRLGLQEFGVHNLTYNSQTASWNLDGLQDGESLASDKLSSMRNALDDLRIVDIRKKPAGLSNSLKGNDELVKDEESFESLMTLGFTPVQAESADGEVQVELLSEEGDITVSMADGVQYLLRFGSLQDSGNAPTTNRYLMVAVEFKEDLIPEPTLQEIPADLQDVEVPEGDDTEPTDPKVTQKKAIVNANKRLTDEYTSKVTNGKKHAQDLTERFADWFYVIPDDVYRKIHLGREDFVKGQPIGYTVQDYEDLLEQGIDVPAKPEEGDPGAGPGGLPPGFPGGFGLPGQ